MQQLGVATADNKRKDLGTESQNAANKFSKAKLAFLCVPNQSSTKKFSAAGQPAGITSTNEKMLGENIYSSQTTPDPFSTMPQFSPTKVHKLDHDDRSTCTSISDTDDTYSSHSQLKGDKLRAKEQSLEKKTRGRVKIKMEYIGNKLRRYTTFSKRKSGIMKKAYELSTLTGTQVMLLVASETGHVYTFATPKLQPMITSEAGKALIQTCLHQPDSVLGVPTADYDNRMSANGFEETELSYHMPEDDFKGSMPDPCLIPVTSSAGGIPVMAANTIPHGMIPMQGFATMPPEMSIMTHGQMVHHQNTQAMSPSHPSPPPSYSPPGQPSSPHRANTYIPPTAASYPSSPPSANQYAGSHAHHQVMVDEMGYEQRSPSHSPPSGHQHRYSHSPSGMYPATSSPSMARM